MRKAIQVNDQVICSARMKGLNHFIKDGVEYDFAVIGIVNKIIKHNGIAVVYYPQNIGTNRITSHSCKIEELLHNVEGTDPSHNVDTINSLTEVIKKKRTAKPKVNSKQPTQSTAHKEIKITKKRLVSWAKKVKKRDGHKCVQCGTTTDLQAHHIKWKSEFPELALDVDNGETLCEEHHLQKHQIVREKDIFSVSLSTNNRVSENKT